MPFATIKEQRDFFKKNQKIEFEHLLTQEQCQQIQNCIYNDQNRDLWRRNAAIKKISLSKDLAQIAAELMEVRELFIAYDQVLNGVSEASCTLAEISCVQGMVCTWVFCIKAPSNAVVGFFPSTIGSAVFFSAETPIPFEELLSLENGIYFMVAYAKKGSVYIHQTQDPHLHEWKELGLNFGDRLGRATHPSVYTG